MRLFCKNLVSIGLSGGLVAPMDATALHLTCGIAGLPGSPL